MSARKRTTRTNADAAGEGTSTPAKKQTEKLKKPRTRTTGSSELTTEEKDLVDGAVKPVKPVTEFASRVYIATTLIPKGKVSTYQAIAEFIGCPSGSRAVGNALRHNPFAPTVPCHRVVPTAARSSGEVGGFQGIKQVHSDCFYKKVGLLKEEGVAFQPSEKVPLLDVSSDIFFSFPSKQLAVDAKLVLPSPSSSPSSSSSSTSASSSSSSAKKKKKKAS